jgi:murein DD-endopeptidase MepM/ murein hydrolase activator NlpD
VVPADARRVRPLLAPTLLLALTLPASALAESGGGGVAPGSVSVPAPSGGTPAGSVPVPSKPKTKPKPKPPRRSTPRSRGARGPLVTSFSISPSSAYVYGRPARVSFEVRGRARSIHLTLVVKPAGGNAVLRRIDLGDRPTGVPQTYALSGLEGGTLPQGEFSLHLSARGLRGATKASATSLLSFHWHRFPLVGQFTYGVSPDGRFGAPRPGHTHQGQDIPAPAGTPVVAPRGGVVKFVGFQEGGAGNYVVLHGEGEDLDFAFMHLLDGSVAVTQGQRVATGQQIGEVGSTGESTGPHLHFEIWKGAWAAGGAPIDPLPFLRRWDGWS